VKVPPELADTIMATIIYFAATSMIMDKVIKRFKKSKKDDDSKGKNSSAERVVEK
ncbi:ABC transporter permease, partial [Clostridium perfringens]